MIKEYINSPLNFTGNKYKLLLQIIPLFPKNIKTFVDLFGGGFSVGVNVEANYIIYNDICKPLVDLLQNFYQYTSDFINQKILDRMRNWNLDRSNKNLREEEWKENYIRLRNHYNWEPDWVSFYTLISCSFNNQIRFNSKDEFNMPYGARYYNPSLQVKLKKFVNQMRNKKIQFWNNDFRK